MSDDANSVPSERPRKVLTGISSVSWEHPADRAALQAVRSVPGFNEAVRKVAGFFGERGIRLLFQANAVRTGPQQFPKLYSLMTEVNATMDWDEQPPLFVSQTPIVNAGAVGFDKPFIVINSGALSLLNDDEMRVLLGHELGHIMTGHVLYRTVAIIVLAFGIRNLPFLAGIALLPIQLALLEWMRKSELSADRAGLLASQDDQAALRVFLKLAGGGKMEDMNLDAFLEQAREYKDQGGPVDTIYKILNTIDYTHPFNTLRAAELDRWIQSGDYEKIVGGEYPHRGVKEEERPLTDDFGEAASHYAHEAREVVDQVTGAARKAARAFGEAFRQGTKKE